MTRNTFHRRSVSDRSGNWSLGLIGFRLGVRFPSTFMNTAKTILRRLFRVYAHIYHAHFDQICALGIEGVSARLMPVPSIRADADFFQRI